MTLSTRTRRTAMGCLAAILALAAWVAPLRAEVEVPGAVSAAEAERVREMAVALDRWIDDFSDYPPPDRTLSRIVLVPPGNMGLIGAAARHFDGRTRGAYDPSTATVYLQRPWSAKDVHDRGVLLHELVHHRQVGARHWYCPGAMEWDAYKLQETFLAQGGEEARINWIAVVMESSCSPRDHHPD